MNISKIANLIKKALTLSLCVCMMTVMATSASAAGSRGAGVTMELDASNLVMNALTWGQIVSGTKVSLYTPDGTGLQRFYTSNHRLFNETNASYVVGINTADSSAMFMPSNSPSGLSYIDMVPYGGGGYKIQLVDYARYLGAFSVTSGSTLYFKDMHSQNTNNSWYF